jgi:hypothetical protein
MIIVGKALIPISRVFSETDTLFKPIFSFVVKLIGQFIFKIRVSQVRQDPTNYEGNCSSPRTKIIKELRKVVARSLYII